MIRRSVLLDISDQQYNDLKDFWDETEMMRHGWPIRYDNNGDPYWDFILLRQSKIIQTVLKKFGVPVDSIIARLEFWEGTMNDE